MSQYEEAKAQTQSWAFTISDTTKEHKYAKTDYKLFWERCEQFGLRIEQREQEIGPNKGVPHYHGIIEIPKGFYRKKLMMKGLHLKLEELYNKRGWMKYINKTHDIKELPQPEDELIEDAHQGLPPPFKSPSNSPKIRLYKRLV